MRLYPALPTKRTRAVIGDLIVLLLLLLFAWLALKVHDAVDRVAVLGTGVEEAGTEIRGGFDVAHLLTELRALPFESRAPLVLRDIEGWSYEDVAAVLDISVSAAKSRVHRARLQVIRSLTGMGPGGGVEP